MTTRTEYPTKIVVVKQGRAAQPVAFTRHCTFHLLRSLQNSPNGKNLVDKKKHLEKVSPKNLKYSGKMESLSCVKDEERLCIKTVHKLNKYISIYKLILKLPENSA